MKIMAALLGLGRYQLPPKVFGYLHSPQKSKLRRLGVGEIIRGKCYINDADGIVVQKYKVRLNQLDAPEWRQLAMQQDGTWFNHGARVKSALIGEIGGESVEVSVEGYDKYGRVLGRVSCGGKDVGAWMVSQGLAIACYGDRYKKNMRAARAEQRGMWSYATIYDPRDWRAGRRRPLGSCVVPSKKDVEIASPTEEQRQSDYAKRKEERDTEWKSQTQQRSEPKAGGVAIVLVIAIVLVGALVTILLLSMLGNSNQRWQSDTTRTENPTWHSETTKKKIDGYAKKNKPIAPTQHFKKPKAKVLRDKEKSKPISPPRNIVQTKEKSKPVETPQQSEQTRAKRDIYRRGP